MILGLFRILIVFFVVYYLIRFVSFLFNSSRSYNSSANESRKRSSKKEGEVTINYVPDSDKKVNKDSGDYVDYEEVE